MDLAPGVQQISPLSLQAMAPSMPSLTAAFGAHSSLPRVTANVPSSNPQRPLAVGSGNHAIISTGVF